MIKSPYYTVQVGQFEYEVYSKETNQKVNLAKIIADRFDRGEFNKNDSSKAK